MTNRWYVRPLLGIGACVAIVAIIGIQSRGATTTTGTAPSRSAVAAKLGTREAPVPFGSPYEFRKNGRVYTVTLRERDRDALARVAAANRFNPKAPEGMTYIAMRLHLEYQQGSATEPFQTPGGGYELEAGNRRWGAPTPSVAEKPEFGGQNIFPGATVDGWLGGKYLPTELVSEAVLVWDGVYFALD